METAFSVGSAPSLYNEDPRPAERINERVSGDGSENGQSSCEEKT
jgi:hypothetical protein